MLSVDDIEKHRAIPGNRTEVEKDKINNKARARLISKLFL